MTPLRRMLAPVPIRRQAWWLVWALLGGWIVVYNVFRIARADAPRDAALTSLPLGILLGVAIFVGYVAIFRSLAARALVRSELPSEGDDTLRVSGNEGLVRALVFAMGAMAVVAAIVGLVLLSRGISLSSGRTRIVISAWDVVLAAWVAIEIPAAVKLLRGGERSGLEAIDALPAAAMVTCVLAAVGITRDLVSPLQVVLVAIAGVVAVLGYVVLARLVGRRSVPVAAIGAAIVAALALVLPFLG